MSLVGRSMCSCARVCTLRVGARRYPLQLVLRGPFADGEPIAPDSCIHVQLSNPEEGQLGRPALLPLSFEVEVQDLEGEELRAEDLGQLRLAYEVAQVRINPDDDEGRSVRRPGWCVVACEVYGGCVLVSLFPGAKGVVP